MISRNSAFTYKNQAVKVQQVADELGVRYVHEGSVRKGGDRVRISAQLIDADTGHHVWADKFDRDLSDIFEVQDEITKRIAATVAPELEMVEHQRGAGRRTTSLQAWDHYQRGMAAWRKFDREANEQAREMFERAIELDPSYAQAYSGLAATYNAEAWARWAVSRGNAAECAVAAGKQAVVHDPADASIRVTLGIALILAGEFEHAIDESGRRQ